MTKSELEYVKKVLQHIKDPDQYIEKALAYINKDIAAYEARRGKIRDQYDFDMNSF